MIAFADLLEKSKAPTKKKFARSNSTIPSSGKVLQLMKIMYSSKRWETAGGLLSRLEKIDGCSDIKNIYTQLGGLKIRGLVESKRREKGDPSLYKITKLAIARIKTDLIASDRYKKQA